ncbi:hypothetical protein M413DRAFT_239355 [Hebeloma cylindrosporum]|uniref:Uncharacterized protein n=1 Tax=Hebeloma cylindrosporum TaxID=76867 RepID=A0A0C2YD19_HEBCY|nr:hypothetical protein M413DRAFT_239355 [Hebeloma cylindrosporum h7]
MNLNPQSIQDLAAHPYPEACLRGYWVADDPTSSCRRDDIVNTARGLNKRTRFEQANEV